MKLSFKSFLAFIAAGSALLLYAGCEQTNTAEEYRKVPVVNGTLFAGRNIDTLKLNWTGEVDKFYDQSALAIPGASVIIRGIDTPFYDSLLYDPANPGRYYSSDPLRLIQPAKSYSLTIAIPGWNELVSATTTVPDTFRITSCTINDGDTLKYDLYAPVNKFTWSASRFQATYLPTISYLDPNCAMIPKSYYQDTSSSDFQRPPIVDYRVGLPSDQTNTDLPWVFLSYYGNVRFDVYAVDFNYSDFINQIIPAQGGELKEIRYNVSGGIGVFGSKTRAGGSIHVILVP
ncbi:MAG TPA: DUF4249 family protein [Bacteroidota bacterium]|nr:DUF4249 family protein [Bacteroidota bacterium]